MINRWRGTASMPLTINSKMQCQTHTAKSLMWKLVVDERNRRKLHHNTTTTTTNTKHRRIEWKCILFFSYTFIGPSSCSFSCTLKHMRDFCCFSQSALQQQQQQVVSLTAPSDNLDARLVKGLTRDDKLKCARISFQHVPANLGVAKSQALVLCVLTYAHWLWYTVLAETTEIASINIDHAYMHFHAVALIFRFGQHFDQLNSSNDHSISQDQQS